MSDFVKVASLSEVSDGEIKGFDLNGQKIALINLGGEIFATSDVCTHKHCQLSEGFIDNKNIVCHCHGAQFDVKTGEVRALPATEPLKVFEVKLDNGEILVKM